MKLQLKDTRFPVDCDQTMLEKAFAFTYLPKMSYSDWEVERYLKIKCAKAYKKRRIKSLALWLGTIHAREMSEDFWPDITIKWVHDQKGYGTIANVPFKQWSFMGQYSGTVRKRNIFFPDLNDYCFMYPRQWLNFLPLTIDGQRAGNYTRFINHSDFPNMETLAIYYDGMMYIMFRTIRDIEQGEELSYDYGDVYWNKRIKMVENG